MDVSQRVFDLLAPIVATIDVELLDVEFSGGVLRVIVDEVPAEERSAPDLGADAEAEAATPDEIEIDLDLDLDLDAEAATAADESGPATAYQGITMDRVAAVNRLVSPLLDQHDPIPGRYTLEVSSPGLERRLRRAAHYRQAIGEEIIVKMESHLTPRRLRGRLNACGSGEGVSGETAADDEMAEDETADDEIVGGESAQDAGVIISLEVVEIDGVELSAVEEREVALVDIDSARTVFVWGPAPKPGQPGAKKPGKPGSKKSGGSKSGNTSKKNTQNKQHKKKQKKKSSSQPRGSR